MGEVGCVDEYTAQLLEHRKEQDPIRASVYRLLQTGRLAGLGVEVSV